MGMRILSFSVLAFILLNFTATTSAGETIDLGEAVRADGGRLALTVESSDSSIRAIMRRAFELHGGMTVETPENAAFTVRIERAGDGNAALVTIGSGQPYQEQLRRTVSGHDDRDAVLRACDLVVEATLQSKGFFAGQLAFVGKRRGTTEIYASDLLFHQVRPVTSDRALVTGPCWSPDGSRLLHTTYHKTGFPDIYSIHLATGRKQPIATFKGTNTGASYSPDGRRIAMTLSGTGNSEIYVSDTRGRNMRRLTTNKTLEASPSWSPDGRRIVYTSDARGKPQLYTVSANGGAPRLIPTNISGYCSEPAWNPVNPDQIAFTAAIDGGFQIALYDFKKRSSRQLTTGPSSLEPVWLRDGRHLVFSRREGPRSRLMLLDSETDKVSALHQPRLGDASSASYVYPPAIFLDPVERPPSP